MVTQYEPVETLAHIKHIDALGTDPLRGNLVFEIYAGTQDSNVEKRLAAFSIERGALESFLLQAADELKRSQEARMPDA